MSKKYVGEVSLRKLVSLIETALTGKINADSIVNDLTTGGIDKVLSAEQGKALNISKIDKSSIVNDLTTGGTDKVLSAEQGKSLNDAKIDKTAIINDLTTGGIDKVLSAEQGKSLNDAKIDKANIVDNLTTGGTDKVLSAEQGKNLNTKITDFINTKGQANGIAPLESTGLISADYLPSYVDDVIEGYYLDGKFYTENSNTSSMIAGEVGKIFVDLNGTGAYRWGGSVYVSIGSSDISEMTADEVQTIWDSVMAEA